MQPLRFRTIGVIILIISVFLFSIIYAYTQNTIRLNQELHKNCTLPEGVCPYSRSIPSESLFGFLGIGGLAVFGVYLLFADKQVEKMKIRQGTELKNKLRSLSNDERTIYNTIINADGFIFQNELVEKSGLSKVKVTRILDKLEVKGLVERRRRGMSNIVVAKL